MENFFAENRKKDEERYNIIGEFVYLFSHVENQIRAYFCSLFPSEYTDDLCALNPDNGINAGSLLGISQKIHKNRKKPDKGFNNLAKQFQDDLNPARKKILHGCWGITGGLTKSPRKVSKQKTRVESRSYFFDTNEIVPLNTQCNKWITDFNTVTDIPFKERITNGCYLRQYFIVIGEFVVWFSQLEFAIRSLVSDLYKMNDDAFIFCEEDFTLHLLDHLFYKLPKKYEGMENRFRELNKHRNILVHRAAEFPESITNIKEILAEVKKLDQYFKRL